MNVIRWKGENMETISFRKHSTGNFVVKHRGQEIIVLEAAFSKITGVSREATLGSVEVNRSDLTKLGFLVRNK